MHFYLAPCHSFEFEVVEVINATLGYTLTSLMFAKATSKEPHLKIKKFILELFSMRKKRTIAPFRSRLIEKILDCDNSLFNPVPVQLPPNSRTA